MQERRLAALEKASAALMAELGPQGHWTGCLSSSALSTATAVVALCALDRTGEADLIGAGLRWLAAHANGDGGWGDTVRSKSNISTTALVWAAFRAASADSAHRALMERAGAWLSRASGSTGCEPPIPALVGAIKDRYGKDRTFSVPILMTLALSGRLGPDGWRQVPALPFELAALPQGLFGALRLPVVSYALPALIAIGQVIHHHRPSANPLARLLRNATCGRTLALLSTLQPANGGFLEATPLTSFVTMSLAAMGEKDHPVARKGLGFLRASARPDGSWPIDTNLATWVSTLAIKALSHQPAWAPPETRLALREWLLGQQYRSIHPYTRAAPGGWAWTDLPGGVPDADDTPGALLALLGLGAVDPETARAGRAGVRWLLDLQNRDGGIPTFCRGWGALPFDRSSADLTAHTLRAWSAWLPQLDPDLKRRVLRAIERGLGFLANQQQPDGAWLPLWFGNEHAPGEANPTYGTAQVVLALRALREAGFEVDAEMLGRGLRWLAGAQNRDGSWSGVRGGPPSIEESALALEALAASAEVAATDAGERWLVGQVESGRWREPAPVGFYFAKLWYWEALYPLVFTAGALGRLASLK